MWRWERRLQVYRVRISRRVAGRRKNPQKGGWFSVAEMRPIKVILHMDRLAVQMYKSQGHSYGPMDFVELCVFFFLVGMWQYDAVCINM